VATSSTIPAAKTALVSLIGAALATSGPGSTAIQVAYGRPADNLLARECVYVGDVTGTQSVPVARGSGRKTRQEEYRVEVVVAVLMVEGEVTDAEARAYTLLAEVEDVVADDSTLGLATNVGYFQATTGSFDAIADYTDEGPACVLRLNVDCKARLV
jgi:hypothetical protein